jgi:N-acetylglucosaminyl-diphospho-decaprenol L-rhamnosyltransferase
VSEPPVTVAVVSHNTRALLVRCLDSVSGDVAAGRARVVVVDNRSADGSEQAARAAAPWAEVVQAGENLGFGAAVNLAARGSRSPWLVAANADVELRAGALEALLAAGEDPRVGAIAPRLELPGGGVQHSVGPLPGVALALTFALGLHRVSRRLGDRLCLEGAWDPGRPRDVPWAVGACLVLRRSAFDAVGGFDESEWMYGEDLDLCWRLGDAGYRTRYVPGAVVGHVAAAATSIAFGDERRRRRRFMAATYRVIARRRGRARSRGTAAVNALGAAGRLVWLVPVSLVDRSRRAGARDTADWLIAHLQGVVRGQRQR